MEVCKLLVECHADLNVRNYRLDARPFRVLLQTKVTFWCCFDSRLHCSGWTALHVSSEKCHVEVCKLLVQYQADLNVKNYRLDARPVHILMMAFCSKRCNSRFHFRGATALYLSSRSGHVEVCKLLVECDADVNVKEYWCDAGSLHVLLQTKAGLRL